MDDDMILVYLNEQEKSGAFKIKNKEYEILFNSRKESSKELFDFINRKVHPRIRKKLIRLIERYNDDYVCMCSIENQIYYKTGFSDAMKLLLNILNT